jgi:hypothetical protein
MQTRSGSRLVTFCGQSVGRLRLLVKNLIIENVGGMMNDLTMAELHQALDDAWEDWADETDYEKEDILADKIRDIKREMLRRIREQKGATQ